MLHIRRKPNSFRARMASACTMSGSSSASVTPWAGTTACASAAAATSHFARRTSGWSNWPGLCIAAAGTAPWCALTKSSVPKSRLATPESVVVARDQGRHRPGVRALLADGRAVLAIAGNVEDRTHLALERQGLSYIALAARVVDARRQRRQRALGAVERGGWMQASDHFTSGHSRYTSRRAAQSLQVP